MNRIIYGKKGDKIGTSPAIILNNPKYDHNLGATIRAASCFGVSQVIYTGNRIQIEEGNRIPREERMKGYQDVSLIQFDYPFDLFDRGIVPVAIELRKNSENLAMFEHPENAVYVFGPEDGSIAHGLLQFCHRFVVIPSRHCLNLSAAVYTVLYDRSIKRWQQGLEDLPTLMESRG